MCQQCRRMYSTNRRAVPYTHPPFQLPEKSGDCHLPHMREFDLPKPEKPVERNNDSEKQLCKYISDLYCDVVTASKRQAKKPEEEAKQLLKLAAAKQAKEKALARKLRKQRAVCEQLSMQFGGAAAMRRPKSSRETIVVSEQQRKLSVDLAAPSCETLDNKLAWTWTAKVQSEFRA